MVLAAALALTAGCGGGNGGKPQGVKASGAVSTPKLTSALLTSSDVPHVQVIPASTKSQLLGGPQKTSDPACQPVADQWVSRPKYPRQVYTGAMVTDTAAKDKKAKTVTLEVIASYKRGDAHSVLDALTTALKTCRKYEVTRNGVASTFSVEPVTGETGTLGDQQATYRVTDTARGTASGVLVTVVRVGDTTAAYETVRADHTPATLRAAITLKQTAKLRKAASG